MNELLELFEHEVVDRIYHVNSRDEKNHLDAFNDIDQSTDFYSIIVKKDVVDDSLRENPKYYQKIPEMHVSQIECSVRHELFFGNNNRLLYPDVEKIVLAHDPDLKYDEKNKQIDYYFKCLELSMIPEVFEEKIWYWAYDKWIMENREEEDFEEAQCTEMKNKYQEEYDELKKELFMPRFEYRYELKYENFIPEPLLPIVGGGYITAHYVFLKDGKITMATGSSAGSGTRETHGFYGHLFAEVQKKIKPVKSFVLRVDKFCNLKLERSSDNLILYQHDLRGNYQICRAHSEKIVSGIEML